MTPAEMMTLAWDKADLRVLRKFEDIAKMGYKEGESLTKEERLARQIQNDAFLREAEWTVLVSISGDEFFPRLDGVTVWTRLGGIISAKINFDGLVALIQQSRVNGISFS